MARTTSPDTSTSDSVEPSLAEQIAEEREHLAESRAALGRMRERAQHLFHTGDTVAGDAYSAETLGRTLSRRVAELADDPRTPLFFGRLTFEQPATGEEGDEPTEQPADSAEKSASSEHIADSAKKSASSEHIADSAKKSASSEHIADSAKKSASSEPITDSAEKSASSEPITDSAEKSASSGHRGDYHIGRRHVTDDAGEPMVLDWRAPLSRTFYQASARDPQGVMVRRRFGFQAGSITGFEDEHLNRGEELGTASRILTDEIERPRVGPMRDIVATIQPEQDELVRAELDETICVQGAPGTGKTAVGLHRAAYLLYQHRERLRRSGVLVVGPNRAFLHYISAVLPALGEVEVEQSSVDDLFTTVAVRGQDAPEVAALKHDARLATVLAAALAQRVQKPLDSLVVSDGSWRWRISTEALRRIVDDVRREHPHYALGRERVRARTVAMLQRQAEARRGDSPPDSWLRRMGRSAEVRGFVDHVWPDLSPEQLVHSVLSDVDALAAAAGDLLTAAEQATLLWQRPPRTVKTAKWSAADVVLIDEAAGLIDRLPSFGHVVLDEAQDLSPMQCRAIARRIEHGSITLLGDLAQGTAAWASRDWADTLTHLGKPGSRVVPLTTGFRVPAVIVELANRLLPALDVAVPAGVSLRRDGSLVIRAGEDLAAETVTEVRAALSHEGSIGVIAADAAVEALTLALRAAGVPVADLEADERVTVLPASLAKGLEYDHVIVVEPAAIVAAEPRGLNRLYVVLTRAVSRLTILHTPTRPLPTPLSPPPPR